MTSRTFVVALSAATSLCLVYGCGSSADVAGAASQEKPKVSALAPPPAPPDVAAPPADSKKTASGLASKVLTPGTGTKHPAAADTVTVQYSGWTTQGKLFDSSIPRGKPSTFPLNRVIKGWTEGVQLMVVGEKRRFWIPDTLAYKDMPGRPQGLLVFDVELLGITPAIVAPEDVKEPPGGAKMTSSGISYRILQEGKGTRRPASSSTVTVHYSGWTTDGKLFDSSVQRGEPLTIRLDEVIPGWTETVQLMVEGEKVRVWIPERLAYKGAPGAPAGTLVFDIELITFK